MIELEEYKPGQPTVVTDEVITLLEQAFSLDCSVLEACRLSNIAKSTYYNFLKRYPEYVDRFKELREDPILKARQTIVNDLDNTDTAKWYLERKKKAEFAQRHENINVELPVPLLDIDKLKQ